MRRRGGVAALGLALVAMTACPYGVAETGGDCNIHYEARLARFDESSGERLWKTEIPWPHRHPLFESEGDVVTVSDEPHGTTVSAWDESGDEDWSVKVDDAENAWTAYVDRSVDDLVLTREESIDLVSLAQHRLVWSSPATSPLSAPVISDDAVFSPQGKRLSALDRGNGHRMWRSAAFASHPVSPVLTDDAVVTGALRPSYGSKPGPLTALALDDGHELWRSPRPPSNSFRDRILDTTDGVIVDFQVKLGGGSFDLVGIDEDTGHVVWTRHFDGKNRYSLTRDVGALILVPNKRGRIEAIEPATGKTAWSVKNRAGGVLFGATLEKDTIYVLVGDDDAVDAVALDRDDGARLWTTEMAAHPLHVTASPDSVLVGSSWRGGARGTLTRLDPSTGEELWSADFRQPIQVPPLVVGGDVVAASADDEVGCV